MNQPDLLRDYYPKSPGFKAEGTSREAAKAIAPRTSKLRDQAIALLKVEAMTADEVAGRMDRTVLCIRPRLSEALKLGLIYDTGKTRKNASGINATVWKAML